MTRSDTAILAIRLAALYAWFQAVEYVAIAYLFAQTKVIGQTSPLATFLYALSPFVLALAGVFLWFKAPGLARHFVGVETATTTATAPASSSAVPLAFAVVGLAIFLHTLPRAVTECITLSRASFGRDASQEFLKHLPSLAGTAVQLTCGLILFVRPHRLARWWERKRDGNVSG